MKKIALWSGVLCLLLLSVMWFFYNWDDDVSMYDLKDFYIKMEKADYWYFDCYKFTDKLYDLYENSLNEELLSYLNQQYVCLSSVKEDITEPNFNHKKSRDLYKSMKNFNDIFISATLESIAWLKENNNWKLEEWLSRQIHSNKKFRKSSDSVEKYNISLYKDILEKFWKKYDDMYEKSPNSAIKFKEDFLDDLLR